MHMDCVRNMAASASYLHSLTASTPFLRCFKATANLFIGLPCFEDLAPWDCSRNDLDKISILHVKLKWFVRAACV